MFSLFVKRSKSQQAAIDEHKHRPVLSMFYGLIILGFTLLSFSLNFELRLVDILGKTSMRDDTETLTRFDRYLIKRMADQQEVDTKIHFGYQISDENIELPRLAKPTLFIRVFPSKQFVAAYLPEKYRQYEGLIEKNLHSCLFQQGHELKVCLQTSMKIFQKTYASLDKNPFGTPTPYIYTDKFSQKEF